jgi:hypothetical protein
MEKTKGLTLSQLTNEPQTFSNGTKTIVISGYEKLWNAIMIKLAVKYRSEQERNDNLNETLPQLIKLYPNLSANSLIYALDLLLLGKLHDANGDELRPYQVISIVNLTDIVKAYFRYEKALFGELIKSGKLYLDNEPQRPTESQMRDLFISELKIAHGLFLEQKQYDKIGLDVFVYDELDKLGFAVDYNLFMQKAKVLKTEILRNINQKSKSLSISETIRKIAMTDAENNSDLISTAKMIALNESIKMFEVEIKNLIGKNDNQ